MKYIIITIILVFPFIIQCQDTGSFQKTISFDKDDYTYTRTLYYYVPEDYDATQAYKLVVGFRGGPHSNAGQFRDQLTFLADSLDAIVLCPENIDHFDVDEGLVKQLFNYSVDTTSMMYNIDPAYIYLTGLSFGGRHAIRVSMDIDDGEIPNIRGVIPFAAGRNSQLVPDYEEIDQFAPACICIGLSDAQVFKTVSNTIHNEINANAGKSFLNEITGVGHTVAFSTYPTEFMKCIKYIESQYEISNTDDLDVSKITISPNPASNIITIEGLNLRGVFKVEIYNMIGEMLYNRYHLSKEIWVDNLSPGTYFLKIVTTQSQHVTLLMITK